MATMNQVGVTLSGQTGTGNFVGATSATLVTPASLGVQQAALNMNSHLINNVTNPSTAQDAATKAYVDAVATGLEIQASCTAASTTALTVTYANGASGVGATLTNATTQATFSIDGISATVGQRILIKNQASTLQNGIYTVTNVGSGASNWVLTRATDYDEPSEVQVGDFVVIDSGTANANTSWLQTATVTTIGTDAITFIQFTASLPISLANGGTGAAITASNGGIFYSNASTGALLSGTATAGLALLSGASTTPTWSSSKPITRVIIQTFATPGANTYTPTTGMTYCTVSIVGGGGGSGGCATGGAATCGASGSGGGGGCAIKTFASATIGGSQTVTIGAAGSAGAAAAGNGGAGGASTFGALLTANGGAASNGYTATGSTTTGGGAAPGGTASGGDFNAKGQYTLFPTIFAAGVLATAPAGGGNHLFPFGGGQPNQATANQSSPGIAPDAGQYGCGGSAACVAGTGVNAAGAAGTAGFCIITEYVSV